MPGEVDLDAGETVVIGTLVVLSYGDLRPVDDDLSNEDEDADDELSYELLLMFGLP